MSAATPTFIGANSVFVGNIRGSGHIQAHQAIVAGKITGGLSVKDKLEIGYTAVIRGKVSARTVAIAKGAIVDGEIEVTSDSPMLQFEEKRDGMP